MILEWDWSCLERKFNKCVAHCTVEGETKWRWIQAIEEDGVVFTTGSKILGAWRTEQDGVRCEDYPVVEFHYTPIPVGWMHTATGIAMLFRRHMGKVFKVGIENEGYALMHLMADSGFEDSSARFYNLEFKPDMGVYNRTLGNKHIFSPYLWANKSSLKYLNQEIGFVEDHKCFLLNESFTPLVKPYLGEQWQIVSCG